MKSLWIIKSPSVSSWLQYVSINPSTQRAMMSPRLLCLSNWSRRMRHTSVFFGVNRRSRYPQMGQSTGWVETNRLDRLVFWYQWDYLLINQVKKIRASKIGHDNIYKNIYIYIITYVKILLIFWLLVPHCSLTVLLSIFGMVILSEQLALL